MTMGRGSRLDRLAGLVDEELHAVEFEQEIVRELDIGLVDLVDQQHRPHLGGEGLPQLAALDVVADVRHARIAELAVAQAGDRIVFVEPLLGLGGGLDVPGDAAERSGSGRSPPPEPICPCRARPSPGADAPGRWRH